MQVVAMKLECNPESFTTDPEGSQLASTINEHLPAEVRISHLLHFLALHCMLMDQKLIGEYVDESEAQGTLLQHAVAPAD